MWPQNQSKSWARNHIADTQQNSDDNLSAHARGLFTAAAEEIILAARLRGGIRSGAAVDEQSMARLDAILMPPAGTMPPGPDEMEQENYDLFK